MKLKQSVFILIQEIPNTNGDINEEDVTNHISLPRREMVGNTSNPEACASNDDDSNNEEVTVFSTLQATRGDNNVDLTNDDTNQQDGDRDNDSEFNNQINSENESYNPSLQDIANDNDKLYEGDLHHDEVKWKIMLENSIQNDMQIRDSTLYEDDNIDDWLFINEGDNEDQEQTNKEHDASYEESDNFTYSNNVQSYDDDSNNVLRDGIVMDGTAEIEISRFKNHKENQSIVSNNFTTSQKTVTQISSSVETSNATISHNPSNVEDSIPMITIDAPDIYCQ